MVASEESGAALGRFDVADAAPLVLDAQAVVVGWGRDAERLLGYAAAEVLGRSAAELLAGDDAARLPELRERCRRDGGWAGPVSVRRRDGCPQAVMVRVVPVLERGGSPRRVALVAGMAGDAGWDMSRAVLERMVEHSPLGIAVVDTDLRFVWSNAALEQYGGGPAAGRIGRRLAEIQPVWTPRRSRRRCGGCWRPGIRWSPTSTWGGYGPARTGRRRTRCRFTRLDDDLGHPIGVSYTVVDVTEGYRARTRLALLDRAGQHIGSTLDVTRTAQELADVVVPELADFVAVDLVESVLSGGEPAPGAGTVALRRAGHQSVNDGVPEAVVAVGDVARYLAGSPPVRCLTSGESWRAERLDPLAKE
ncbi:PAS domain-containing protein [Streptomyces sp. MK5]|uniref:PAS domain-containing protein n=1 Tax=Streptomyces sp. MK5 TaxID=3064253 RepID=UPI002740FC42|nr:PAS domain-containing protein [Streptomyces sp. MK5]